MRWRTSVVFLGLVVGLAWMSAPAWAQGGKHLAEVNGEVIPWSTLDEEIVSLKKRFSMFGGEIPEEQLTRFRARIVDRLIEDLLLEQAMNAAGTPQPTPTEVNAELLRYKEKIPGGAEQYAKFLERANTTEVDVVKQIATRLRLKAFLGRAGGMKVASKDVKAYYDDNRARYKVTEQVKAAHILVKVDESADAATKRAAKAKIERIHKQAMRGGTDFGELAKETSEGPSGPKGGDLGFFTRGRMVKPFEDMAFSLKAGQVSKPFKTRFGWHIVKVYKRTPAGTMSFKEVSGDIRERLEAGKFKEERTKVLAALKDKAKITIYHRDPVQLPKP